MRIFILLTLLSLTLSCGREAEDTPLESSDNSRGVQAEESYTGFISNQKVDCFEDQCNEAIAKLVVIEKNSIRYCTGTLIKGNQILTSASCLPSASRISHLKCSNESNLNIYAIFPQTGFAPAKIASCDKVEFTNHNTNPNPSLWKADIAVISLKENIERKAMKFSRTGITSKTKISAWTVNYKTDFLGELKQEKCEVLFDTYLNPFSKGRYSPMLVMSQCDLGEGSVGAPIVSGGRVLGVYSKEMNHRLKQYLINTGQMGEVFDNYYHFSNLACSRFTNEFVTRKLPKSCNKKLSLNALEIKRNAFLKDRSFHGKTFLKVKKLMEEERSYFYQTIVFIPDESGTMYETHLGRPKCIWKSRDWIDKHRTRRGKIYSSATVTFEKPNFIIKSKLSSKLKPMSIIEDWGFKKYTFNFNPYRAHVKRKVDVQITSELLGEEDITTYSDITNKCR